MLSSFLIPFLSIGLAELGDKTQLAVLLLSSKTKRHFELLAGVMLAFLLVDGLAVWAGAWIAHFVPLRVVRAVSGLVFILVGGLILKTGASREEVKSAEIVSPFFSGFLLIFLSEWGDKTQIAAGLFATKYPFGMVLAGTLAALGALSWAAVYLGGLMASKLKQKIISRIAGGVFLLIGISALLLK